MARYGKKKSYRKKRSTYRKRKSKTAYKKKRASSKSYGTNRAIAIPRATFTATSKLVEFVWDQTWVLKNAIPPGQPGKNNSFGMHFLVNDLYRPANLDPILPQTQQGPVWGACFPYGPQGSTESVIDSYEGTHRWLSSGNPTNMKASPYRRSTVMKTKVDYRVTQLTVYTDGGVVPTADQCVSNIAIIAGFRQSSTANGTRNQTTSELYDVETDRNQKRHNMSCQTAVSTPQNAEQVRGSQTMSAKSLYGFKDWKDNSVGQNKESICAQENHSNTAGQPPGPPQNSVFWHIGFYDRYPNVNNEQYVMPDVEIRIKMTSLVMLTMPNPASNQASS